jgi:Mrp family chromosome partitioning ATPase
MERLKAALDKARTIREEGGARSGGRRVVPSGSAALRRKRTDAVNVAWAAIQPFEVDASHAVRNRLVTLEGGTDAAAFDILRTKVLQMTAAKNWRRIALTSPLPGSGKTTTTLNLALSLSRQGELRIAVIDLDLRRPALSRALGVLGEGNVADILEGRISFADHVRRLGNNLALAMNYSSAHAASDLLLRRSSAAIIDEIERVYQPDLMLFDMPPLLVNDDASAFLGRADCGIIVAEADSSTISQVDLCEKEVAEQTNVLGVVLNKCRFPSDGYAYYYDYKYE